MLPFHAATLEQHQPFNGDRLDLRDPKFIARVMPWIRLYVDHYVRLKVDGAENITGEPALFVANHNGGIFGPDLLSTLGTLWQTLSPEHPLYALAHDVAMRKFTPLGRLLQRFGAVRASFENGMKLLREGAQVLVYPGGDIDAYRSFRRRNEVILGRRLGFVRLAREAGVPIVPLVCAGAHKSAIVLHDGAQFASLIKLKDWARTERFPVALCLPWGIAFGPFVPYLPLPLPLKLSVLPHIYVARGDSLEAAQARVHRAMQSALSELSAE